MGAVESVVSMLGNSVACVLSFLIGAGILAIFYLFRKKDEL